MIVNCQNCDTSFELDESRVPKKGIRVRCSRCKEAFFLAHPDATPDEVVEDVVGAAAATSGEMAPDTTQDLPTDAEVAGATDVRTGATDEDEHDWEFNVDPNASVDSETDPGLHTVDPNEASGLSLEDEDEQESNDPVDVSQDDDESAFGSVDDFSSLMEEDDPSPAAAAMDDEVPEVASEPKAVSLADAGQHSEAGTSDDLGDPESWDFFGDEEPAPPSGGGAVLGRIELTTRQSPEALPSLGDALEQDADWDDDLYDPETSESSRFTSALVFVLGGAGWLVTLAITGIGLASGIWSSSERLVITPQSETLGSMRAESIRGFWLDTARGETLLEVRGELVNTTDRALQPEGLLEISLIDAYGQPLPTDSVLAGTQIGEIALREAGPDELSARLNRAATELATTRLEAGEKIPFQAVFREPPADADGFALRFEAMQFSPRVGHANGESADGAAQALRAGGSVMPGDVAVVDAPIGGR